MRKLTKTASTRIPPQIHQESDKDLARLSPTQYFVSLQFSQVNSIT